MRVTERRRVARKGERVTKRKTKNLLHASGRKDKREEKSQEERKETGPVREKIVKEERDGQKKTQSTGSKGPYLLE